MVKEGYRGAQGRRRKRRRRRTRRGDGRSKRILLPANVRERGRSVMEVRKAVGAEQGDLENSDNLSKFHSSEIQGKRQERLGFCVLK